MVEYEKEGFEEIFDGFDFFDRELNEFLRLDLAHSFLDSTNDRIDVFGFTLDFFKFSI